MQDGIKIIHNYLSSFTNWNRIKLMLAQNIFDKPYKEYTTLRNKSCIQQEPQDGDTCSHHTLNQIS
jgi:hypothetical protein